MVVIPSMGEHYHQHSKYIRHGGSDVSSEDGISNGLTDNSKWSNSTVPRIVGGGGATQNGSLVCETAVPSKHSEISTLHHQDTVGL